MHGPSCEVVEGPLIIKNQAQAALSAYDAYQFCILEVTIDGFAWAAHI